ncbi:MAG: Na+/H+ antiporter NhaC family protein [Candidatus Krumholzibacteriia bacterium]
MRLTPSQRLRGLHPGRFLPPRWREHRPRLTVPHVFVLLAGVILVCSLLTWVVPSGSYERETRLVEGRERTLLVPGTFAPVPKHIDARGVILGEEVEGRATPVGLHGFLTAIPRGLEEAADIIFFIFIVGGVFGILQRTGVITASIGLILRALGGSGPLLTVALMVAMAAGGSTLGMGEEFIPLVPVFLALSQRLGYDRLFGMALVLLAADTGFAASTTNPFTVAVAQGIAEVPLQSGLGLRLIFFVCALTVATVHLLRYGARVRRDPSRSLVADIPWSDAGEAPPAAAAAAETPTADHTPFLPRHAVILVSSVAIFATIIIAVQRLGWWMADMGGGFLLMGVVAAVAARLSLRESSRAFVKGLEEMVVAALVVGFARGIAVVLADGQIIDTIIHGAASLLEQVPRHLAVIGMLGFESILNFFIPSGSGQAAVSMPLMAPLADVLGVTRQTAVFAFTCGDGFTNMVIPTSGILMAMLGLARIPYGRWLRFMLPLFLQLMALSAVFLMIAVAIGYS